MAIQTLTVVGVGLLGGSVAMAARQRGLAERIVGVDQHPALLERVLRAGLVDEGSLALADGVREADLVVFCTPVDRIAEQVLAAAQACRPGTLLTDVGSTKGAIVRQVEQFLPSHISFVGSHPLAGSEKSGHENASAGLFKEQLVVVTPTDWTPTVSVNHVTAFWQDLGARVRVMGPEEHDRALALTSHLPHLLASALAGVLPLELLELTATGFRDTTRLAAGNPQLWQAIFLTNREAVVAGLEQLGNQLHRFREALVQGDGAAIEKLLEEGKQVREKLKR
jgi:cyclohexadieny/prephenate dehydrogenase